MKERRNHRTGTKSGGEPQLLAVGRALISDPKFLMLDEPSLGLAPRCSGPCTKPSAACIARA
ncbi:ATP-binding cassette domain-containing protein [Bradyrhizobium sp. 21]|uniref:ATP-binding cassette domain-containing protein n=1 Tax=Bradyrhizobium sp. 21 TaxID=2782666 RepID=UPI001FF8EE33|nr:ATP-binding cassette domain-containing protein [Bradyrhizobium sp. 21]